MRYSMLVYISKMGRTLLEAAQYLRTAPEDALRTEITESGRQMLAQIREVLEHHRNDLHTEVPLVQLSEVESLWGSTNEALGAQLEQFIQGLPEQISYQVRAVFFAELGEKWDAMESVYEYMRDDPRFDPVVVRTPVGRVVERDGKREQEIIYKDFLSPMGIPALSYEQYSIEEDCPELAFISQPYESCTLEQFWPEYIAKYTRLVYLPYFLPAIVLKDYPTTLCQMRVYDVAWKVIGSNQKHYKYYCRYAHHGGANMLVTGVPKIDPVIKAKEQGLPMPAGWKKLSGKTVFLWNSWFDINVSSLRFWKDIFTWFECHKDAALIWRPHPMTDTVVKLYSPERYSELTQYLAKIKDTSNIILDEETSYLPAFIYSDAQISDHSSLMQQYFPMDKPLLWVNTLSDLVTEEEFISTKWMERASDAKGILLFLERVSRGEDTYAELRKQIYRKEFPMADGQCGKRVCEQLWEALHQEDMLTESDEKEE